MISDLSNCLNKSCHLAEEKKTANLFWGENYDENLIFL